MAKTDFDFEEDAQLESEKPAAEGDLKKIISLAEQQLDLEAQLTEAEEKTKKLRADLKQIAEVALPEAMKEAKLKEFTLDNGAKVSVKQDMSISVPKKNLSLICKWLRKNKQDGLITHEVAADIPKGSDALAKKAIAALKKLKLTVTDSESVNSGSLKALLKREREAGKKIDLELFGAYEYTKAEIKLDSKKQEQF